MKKMLLIAVVMVLAASVAYAGTTIVGSSHDMRQWISGATNTEVCVYCHTPHQSGTSADPLWNHSMSSFGSYGAYTSATMDATAGAVAGNDGSVSALCMSCHDGTVAVNALYNPPNQGTVTGTPTGPLNGSYQITSAAMLGTDLTNDHPVNFDYQTSITNGDTGLNTGASVSALLIGGNVTCASCHQVHDPSNVPFLRMSNANSALCTTCHNK